MSVEDRFSETLEKVPDTCLEENANGHKCTLREGHDGPHNAAGVRVVGVEVWSDGGPIATRDYGEATAQTTLVRADGGCNDRSVDTGNDRGSDL